MKTKILAASIFLVGLLGLIAIPAFASGSTVSQVYTVTLTSPTLGLTLTPPTESTASQILPNSDVLSSTSIPITNSGYAFSLKNSGNVSGNVSGSVEVSGGVTEVAASSSGIGSLSANQTACMLYSTTPGGFAGYYDQNGNLNLTSGSSRLGAGDTFTNYPEVGIGAGTGPGNYTFTFNFTIS